MPKVKIIAVMDVMKERKRQDKKWGEQNLNPFVYITILGEEYGELCQATLETSIGRDTVAHMREEAVHTAAVALAIVECLDRQKFSWESTV